MVEKSVGLRKCHEMNDVFWTTFRRKWKRLLLFPMAAIAFLSTAISSLVQLCWFPGNDRGVLAMKVMKGVILSLFFFLSAQITLADGGVCSNTLEVSPAAVLANAFNQCELLSSGRQKRRFIGRQVKRMRVFRRSFSRQSWAQIRKGFRFLRNKKCKRMPARFSDCASAVATERVIFLNGIGTGRCNKEYSKQRRSSLKRVRRIANKLEKTLGVELVLEIEATVKELMKSTACGQGGSDLLAHCSSIQETADGIGKNVYKTLHYAPYLPIFITRDDSKNCSARRASGALIEKLTYAGLNNPDEAGLRHHYRFARTCEQLPTPFFIECSGRCYEIDTPCDRID